MSIMLHVVGRGPSETRRSCRNHHKRHRLVVSHIVAAEVNDEVLGARGSHVPGVVDFVRTNVPHRPRTQSHRTSGHRQLHRALADEHHFLTKVLMGRVIHFTGGNIALVALELEARMRLAGEHPALAVLAVGGPREVFKSITLWFPPW